MSRIAIWLTAQAGFSQTRAEKAFGLQPILKPQAGFSRAMADTRSWRGAPPTQQQLVQTVATVNAVTSVNSIMVALRDLEPQADYSLSSRKKIAHRELYTVANTDTPCGTLCQRSQVVGKAGSQLGVYFASPYAVVSCACARPDGFFHLLASIIEEHGATDVLFYLDGATPGNTRRGYRF